MIAEDRISLRRIVITRRPTDFQYIDVQYGPPAIGVQKNGSVTLSNRSVGKNENLTDSGLIKEIPVTRLDGSSNRFRLQVDESV